MQFVGLHVRSVGFFWRSYSQLSPVLVSTNEVSVNGMKGTGDELLKLSCRCDCGSRMPWSRNDLYFWRPTANPSKPGRTSNQNKGDLGMYTKPSLFSLRTTSGVLWPGSNNFLTWPQCCKRLGWNEHSPNLWIDMIRFCLTPYWIPDSKHHGNP